MKALYIFTGMDDFGKLKRYNFDAVPTFEPRAPRTMQITTDLKYTFEFGKEYEITIKPTQQDETIS